MELLPGARFRIPVQNLGGAWGSGLVGRSSGFPDHPGGPQFIWVLGPGISAPEFQPRNFSPGTAGALRKSTLSTRAGLLKKNSIFSKKATLILKSQFCQSLF